MMKIFISIYKFKKIVLFNYLFVIITNTFYAQNDTNKINRVNIDTNKMFLNSDAVYNRPFLKYGKIPIAIGGYAEANTQYKVTDGVSDGFSFQMKRMTLFLSSSIHRKIKFLSEIEFEDGTKEINIEFAALDFQLHHLLNFRSGIIMNPIGAFNQNHDGPKWEFIDRPISATQMLPSTFSNIGFGIFGKSYQSNFVWSYEFYLTNGFNDNIISNTENKTFLPSTKLDVNRFEESYNGIPLTNFKTAVKFKNIGELGISYMGGVYNKFEIDGLILDKKRRADVFAIDYNTQIPKLKTTIITEFAWVFVDVPNTYSQQFGNKQHGGFIDIVQPILKRNIFGFEKATLNIALRTEYVDWNYGKFKETNTSISDDIFAIIPAISFRPTAQTVIRLNYRLEHKKDLLGNPASKTGVIQLGVSSYF
ncbi:MAG: hypothetical protein U0V03_07985 [Bacteroidia bacterium]